MPEPITPYDLPASVKERLLTLAAESDLLLIGEVHGTQEVPRLMLGLLPALADLGYGGLALEIPVDQRGQLLRCAQAQDAPPPMFGPSDFRDGRGNVQALSMVRQAAAVGWNLLCFDMAMMHDSTWVDRDHGMALNLQEQWGRYCPEQKVFGVCGNLHSRLMPPTKPTEFWPSFAHSFQQAQPNLTVKSINVIFQRGAFFNGEVRKFDLGAEFFSVQAEVRPAGWAGHTVDLYLPRATPVTFIGNKEA